MSLENIENFKAVTTFKCWPAFLVFHLPEPPVLNNGGDKNVACTGVAYSHGPPPPTHTFCATAGANPHTSRSKAGWVGRMQVGGQAWCRKLGEAVFWQLRVAREARSAAQCEDGRWEWSGMKHLFTINREQMA